MKRDRFLIGILVGIGLLVVVALAVFFTRQVSQGYVAETTPDGVVHNFFFAYQQRDFERAYSYLADDEEKPSFTEFRSWRYEGVSPGAGIQIMSYDIVENEDGSKGALVDLAIVYSSSGPFDTGYRSSETATLINQDGEWKIQTMSFWYFRNLYPKVLPEIYPEG
jgi:hypothetical protein